MCGNQEQNPRITKSDYLEQLRLCSAVEFAETTCRTVEWVYSCAAQAGAPRVKVGKYLRFRTRAIDDWLSATTGKSLPWLTEHLPDPLVVGEGERTRIRRTLIPISEAARVLSVPVTWFYSAARTHGFPLRKLGKYLVVSIGEFEDWMNECEARTRETREW